ncbi:MAG TPA: MG2 domain-containing protein, partial [Longimicrobium sp.]|nr:MG2 domain-containing protein [Longimicrobium sp.]
MPRPIRHLLAALAAAAALLPAAADAQRSVRIPPLYQRSQVFVEPTDTTTPEPRGLRFSLTQGTGLTVARAPVAAGVPLAAADAARVLDRLPPLRTSAAPSDSFAFPAQTLAAPRTGRTILAAFPPPDSAPAPQRPVDRGPAPVQVVRRAPEGAVDVGAEITIAFSQPMVPLASVGDLAAREVPARLTPAAPGRWRWIDVRTLRFEPQGRLPMATEFTVEVPAGTRAAGGGTLAQAERWTFATPAPTARGAAPWSTATRRDPVMVVLFDQRIDPAAVLRSITVRANGAAVPVRLATAAELAADSEAVKPPAEEAGKWIAFRPVSPLPLNARVQVVVGPGTPSAEGPRRTEAAQEWEFRTYGPLRVEQSRCGWGGECRPGHPWFITLSNPVDPRTWRDEWVRIEPALPGREISTAGQGIIIYGRALPNTRYTVRLDPALRDRFGQSLGAVPPITFNVGDPRAELAGPRGMVVLDPLAERAVSVFSHDHARLRLRIHRVRPEDWPAFALVRRTDEGGPATLPGTRVVDRTVTVDAPSGETRETRIDLAPALSDGLGHAIVAVEALEGSEDEREQAVYFWVQSTRIGLTAFADATELTAWAASLLDGSPVAGATMEILPSASRGTADARGIATLPLPADRPGNDLPAILVARAGADAAILPEQGPGGYATWERESPGTRGLWYVFTDRGLYRPGERVRFKGWVRRMEDNEAARPALPGAGEVAYTVFDPRRNEIAKGTARLSPLGGFDAEFAIPEGANLGAGSIVLRLPDGAQRSFEFTHAFQVQEFRRPEYTVTAAADPGPYFVDTEAEVTAKAAYYAGGALPGAPVRWDVVATPGSYVPPGWDRWRFGEHSFWGWWEQGPRDEVRRQTWESETDAAGSSAVRIDFEGALPPRAYNVAAAATVTDVNRQTWTASQALLVHPADVYVGVRTERAWLEPGDTLSLDVVVVDLDGKPVAGRPVTVSAVRRTYRSVNGRWSEVPADSTACEVASGPEPVQCAFPGVEGGSYEVTAVTTDARGRPTRTVFRLWVWGDGIEMPRPGGGEQRTVELTPDRESYAPGDTARVLVRLPFHPVRGVVTIRRNGLVRVEELRADASTVTVRVPLGEDDVPNVHVQVDAVGATERGEAPLARGVDFASGTVSLSVPPLTRSLKVTAVPADSVTEPDSEAAVDVVVVGADGRPAAGAEVALVVVDEAVLALTGFRLVDPLGTFHPIRGPGVEDTRIHPMVLVQAPDFEPAPGTLVGRVVDARNGQPLGGVRVRIGGVGEGTRTDANGRFRLTGVARGTVEVTFELEGYARARRSVAVGEAAVPPMRVVLVAGGGAGAEEDMVGAVAAEAAMMSPSAPPPPPPPVMARAQAPGAPDAPIAVRTNFDPLAVFSPVLTTGADGRVRLPFKLPSNLTRYRVVAVAVEGGTRYGLGESSITARQPLMVRPSAPRFLNFGDRFELPVVVQNQTSAPMVVDVAARASGVAMTEAGERVTVPAHDRVEVRLAAEAVRAGPAYFQVAAASGARADAAEITLPVWTPATSEAFATYGSISGDSVEVLPLAVPTDAIPAFGGLEVTTSSTALQELTDALLYLVRYPYECSEQIASRVLAIASLRDVLTAFRAEEMPAPEELTAFVQQDLARLQQLQRPDGGWSFWSSGRTWPYVSIHVAHALARAKEKGYTVNQATWDAALRYLRNVPGNVDPDYPEDVRRALHAYALYTRNRMGDDVQADVRRYLAQAPLDRLPEAAGQRRASLPLEVAGWLLSVTADKPGLRAERDSLLRVIDNRATETASTATFATRYTEGEYLLLHSERRTDGVVLEALIAADRDNPLITKTVRGLLGHRVRGRWNDTQENSWVLLALDRYFRAYEAETPEFVARVWLGERFAGGHQFNGRSTDRSLVSVPMRVVQEQRPEAVTVGKEGPGRLYYRAGLRYA